MEDTAYHEAGHAVIGRVLGLVCGYASIKPGPQTDLLGSAQIRDPLTTVNEWIHPLDEEDDPILFKRKLRSAYRGTIIAIMAGVEAERELFSLNFDYDGDRSDRDDIELMAAAPEAELPTEVWVRYEPRMRRQTRRLVLKYDYAIERVAFSLLERETLRGEEIDRIFAETRRFA